MYKVRFIKTGNVNAKQINPAATLPDVLEAAR